MRGAAENLLGREAERDAVCALLERGPVVTVAGVGGVGKTRTASAVAAGESGQRVDMCARRGGRARRAGGAGAGCRATRAAGG